MVSVYEVVSLSSNLFQGQRYSLTKLPIWYDLISFLHWQNRKWNAEIRDNLQVLARTILTLDFLLDPCAEHFYLQTHNL